MSDHSTHHHAESPEAVIKKNRTSTSAAIWFSIIVAGLFVATLNFVEMMGKSAHGHEATHTEAEAPHSEHTAPAAATPAAAPATDEHSHGAGDTAH